MVLPDFTSTLPVGTGAPLPRTVTVNFSICSRPKVTGSADSLTVAMEESFETTLSVVLADVEALKLASPG